MEYTELYIFQGAYAENQLCELLDIPKVACITSCTETTPQALSSGKSVLNIRGGIDGEGVVGLEEVVMPVNGGEDCLMNRDNANLMK